MGSVFGFPIFSDPSPLYTPTFTVGTWIAGLPITNVQDRRLERVARSAGTTSADSWFRIDLKRTCPIGVLALLIPNITKTSTPTVQWKLGTTIGAADVYDSTALQAWPTGLTLDDVVGPDGSVMHIWHTVVPSTVKNARYVQLEILDTGNSDGYIDLARVIVAGVYRPSVHISTGAKSGLETSSSREETAGGAYLYQPKRIRRVDQFTLANAPESEALTSMRRMQQRLGTTGPLFWVFDEADPYRYERSFQGTLRELGALDYNASMLYNSVAYEVAEDL